MSHEQATQPLVALRSSGRRLVVSLGGALSLVDLPERGKLIVGRGLESDVLLDHPSISRRHASLEIDDDVRVEDLGSANGTKIGGVALAPQSPTKLAPGVTLEIGSVLMTLEDGRERASDDEQASPIAGEAMREVNATAKVAAASMLNVLVLGETGSGKELLARRIHALSPRSSAELVVVNCAALVETLLEAELFGYERGAFTGAVQAKTGLLEAASGGTLFLDEVGELPLPTQAKLLRVLESGEVTRVGAVKPRTVDVRFVSATHRDLATLVREGRFREDLFFRLDGVSIRLPPLRERRDEIQALAERFIAETARRLGRIPPSLAADAVERLCAHPWPGNVRELRNVIQRTVVFSQGAVLGANALRFDALGSPSKSSPPPSPPSSSEPIPSSAPVTMASPTPERLERRKRVVEALERAVWNQTRAAAELGISRRTLQTWMIDLAIPRPRGGK